MNIFQRCILTMPARLFTLVLLFNVYAINAVSQKTGDGPIRIHESGRYFITAKGPLFWQGDTEWELFRHFSVGDAKILLKERSEQGFNIIQVMSTGVYPEWGEQKGIRSDSLNAAWINNNPLTPNEAYFKRADSIISFAKDIGVTLVIGVYHATDVEKKRISIQNAKSWANWLARRYKNFDNIIWSMYPHADSTSVPIIDLTVEGIKSGDAGSHLITVHPDPSPKSSSFLQAKQWLSFNTLQTWSSKYINYQMVKADYDKTPVKPVVNGEARYEAEDSTTAFETRRAGYWSYLAGGFYSYGHRDNWKAPAAWRNWYKSEGAVQMKIMGDIFRSVAWWKLIPNQSVFGGRAEGSAAALSSGKDLLVAYLTIMKPVVIRLNSLIALRRVTAWWIDPVSGQRTRIGSYDTIGNQLFYPPKDQQDAILLIGR